jgi:hypothetical protein
MKPKNPPKKPAVVLQKEEAALNWLSSNHPTIAAYLRYQVERYPEKNELFIRNLVAEVVPVLSIIRVKIVQGVPAAMRETPADRKAAIARDTAAGRKKSSKASGQSAKDAKDGTAGSDAAAAYMDAVKIGVDQAAKLSKKKPEPKK